jgi:glycosyltransferase involved in cell wall biosynthesis
MIKLSIIVPFYNVEPFIEECIRSLYNQDISWEEYEVICVDDCSPDGSRAIVEQLQKEYPTLRLICHKENKKLGGARNTGLKVAQGKYIWFVDSDDYIYPNVLRTLLDTADKNMLDILQFDNTRGEENQTKSIQFNAVNKGETYLFEHLNDWVDKIGGAWKQLFAKDFLDKNQLQFIEDAMYEDTDYLLRAFLLANRVQYVSLYGYHYRINLESITSTLVTPVKLAWQVNLVVRCLSAINIAQTSIAKDTISKMVSNILSHLRLNIKTFSRADKRVLKKYLVDVDRCKEYVSWRTWLALRYAITWFV